MLDFLKDFLAVVIAFIPTILGSLVLHYFYIQVPKTRRSWWFLFCALMLITAGVYTFMKCKGAF